MAFGKMTYNGKDSSTILDAPMYLVQYDNVDAVGMSRNLVEGNPTLLRPNTNEYGTQYDPLSFNFALIKSVGEFDSPVFTEAEQCKVETWLTSPKTSRELIITSCDNNSYYYTGIFTNTNWVIAQGGFVMVNLTFKSKLPYPYKIYNTVIWNPNNNNHSAEFPPMNQGTVRYNCVTDEEEEYIYPEVYVINTGENSNFSISNTTTYLSSSYNQMSVENGVEYNMLFDCQRNIIMQLYRDVLTDEYHKLKTLKMKDIGWNRLDNITWLKLYPGINTLSIKGDCKITLKHKVINKRVGGWLV